MAEDNLCTIKLVRPPQYADMLRSYEILLNGKNVGTIGRNGVLEIPAPAGAITIEATIDWGRSRPLSINTVPHQTVEIEVRNRWGALLAPWAISFGKNSYLSLTPRSTAAVA